MALTLEKINNNKKTNTTNSEVKKNIRPWKSGHELGNSFSGTLAAKKAREIIQKNNEIVDEIRLQGAQNTMIESIENLIRRKEIEFENLEKQNVNVKQIKSTRSVFARMKSLIIGH